jgi:hypothetical protein
MALRRKDIELSVEQELPASVDGAPRRARLTTRFDVDSPEEAPPSEALERALRALTESLDRAASELGPPRSPPGRADRDLTELIETYHPRQVQLVDVLRSDGEITSHESDLLREYLERAPEFGAERTPAAATPSRGPRDDAGPRAAPRTVPELLEAYEIHSLRQAGAVRARRQISFEEYMALKRYFASASEPSPGRADERGSSGG